MLKFSSSLAINSKDSVISLLEENTLEFVISYLGILHAGLIAHLIPTQISHQNLQEQIISAKPQKIVC